MFLSNPAKSFLVSLLLLSSTTGCGLLRSNENTTGSTIEEPKSRFPFKTKEPEDFQCDIIETAGETVRRKRLAKKGTWRRVDFDPGEGTHRAVLQIDTEYLIDFGRGIYAENTSASSGGQFSELTNEILNTFHRSEFEETGRDGHIVRYIIRPSDGEMSEIVVHYDESIGLPVKQEFFTIQGEGRTIQFTMEIVNFKTEPDADIFLIPAGYRKVSIADFVPK
jgi:hypothetical protein